VWPGGGLVHAYASVDASAVVEPGAVVFPGAIVGAGCRVGAGSVVGPGCALGDGTVLGYGVSVSHARVGQRCTLHHGVRLGADGFGFAVDAATGALAKKPQTRAVVLGDDVELGANTCVDRGSWRDTAVGSGTKARAAQAPRRAAWAPC
jgi:UDP-3-O-[3-hydroxymyristoyl] glucosamine N-acyltransferase